MTDREDPPEIDPALAVGALAFVIGAAALCWLVAVTTTLIGSGQVHGVSVIDATVATVRLATSGLWAAPREAYPAPTASMMPTATLWWTTTGAVLAATVTACAIVFRRFEPQVARARLARRPGDLRGARPRPWARPRDITDGARGGFTVGRLDRRLIRTSEEAHVALIAPTRAGKTTRYVVPWLLEHNGPAIVTSTKPDILEATVDARAEGGEVWVFDPFGKRSCSWDALQGCATWSGALRQAQWLAEATQQGDSELAGYWRGEAAKLLAPLLYAAKLEGETVGTVLRWVDQPESPEAAGLLLSKGAVAAERQLQAVRGLDDRNRGTTFMSAGSILTAYRYPEVLAQAVTAEGNLTPEKLLDGRPNTLYVIAAERHQRLLEPVLGALLSSLLHAAMERAEDRPRLRVLLDEAANIAPLRELPRLISQAAGHGIRIATVWQSVAQIEDRYRLGMHTILANSAAKIIMGSTTDAITRRYIEALISDDDDVVAGLQHLEQGRAVYVGTGCLPAVVSKSPFWRET